MRKQNRTVSVVICIVFLLSAEDYALAAKNVSRAKNIVEAFQKRKAREWRITSLQEIETIRKMSVKELSYTLASYRTIVTKNGSAGLESLMVVAAAELASRGQDGRIAVQKHLTELARIYKPSDKGRKPNAYVPIVRPHNPVVHFIPAETAGKIFLTQIKTKSTDIDKAAAQDMCSEEALAQYEIRWGRKKAEELRKLCQGMNKGAAEGGKGPGFLAGLSVIDCLIATQERPRADVFTEMAQECAASLVSGSGNPFALNSADRFKNTVTWNLDNRRAVRIRNTDNRIVDADRTKVYPPDAPMTSRTTFDRQGGIVSRETYRDGQLMSITWYDEFGDMTESMEINGNETTHSFYGEHNELLSRDVTRTDENGVNHAVRSEVYENGVISEAVHFNDDGGYTVRRYDENGNVNYEQRYDKDAKPVNADGTAPAPATSPEPGTTMPSGGAVTSECRKLELELIKERIEGDMTRGGRGALDPRVINPNPEDMQNYQIPEDLKCLGISSLEVDISMKCNNLVQCPLDELPDETCACSPVRGGTLPDRQCQFIVTCADGSKPKSNNGQCACEGVEEIFVDPLTGGGPLPADRFSRMQP